MKKDQSLLSWRYLEAQVEAPVAVQDWGSLWKWWARIGFVELYSYRNFN